jgi:hypothetical protein
MGAYDGTRAAIAEAAMSHAERRPCVIPTHTWAGIAVSTLECGLLPITQNAMRLPRTGYHDYPGAVLDCAQSPPIGDLGHVEALVPPMVERMDPGFAD